MKPISFKPCKTCGHRGVARDGSPACLEHQKIITNIEEEGCTWHFDESVLTQCDLCHKKVQQILLYQIDDNKDYCLCTDCANKLYTCHTCAYLNDCGFANDHTMPAYVMQQVQQGFMTMQTQVKNPAMIEKHCISCRCSIDDKGTCAKETNAGQECTHWALRSI